MKLTLTDFLLPSEAIAFGDGCSPQQICLDRKNM
jgi:hypothetical protein